MKVSYCAHGTAQPGKLFLSTFQECLLLVRQEVLKQPLLMLQINPNIYKENPFSMLREDAQINEIQDLSMAGRAEGVLSSGRCPWISAYVGFRWQGTSHSKYLADSGGLKFWRSSGKIFDLRLLSVFANGNICPVFPGAGRHGWAFVWKKKIKLLKEMPVQTSHTCEQNQRQNHGRNSHALFSKAD